MKINRSHKKRELVKTAKRWPWKLEFSKECVTTHLPNLFVLKMDGAYFSTYSIQKEKTNSLLLVGGREDRIEDWM